VTFNHLVSHVSEMSVTALYLYKFNVSHWAWMSVCCECSVLSGRGLLDELTARPEEFYQVWCVVMCGLEKHIPRE
jgi:hypothetical protein